MKFLILPAALALIFCSCKDEAKPQAAAAAEHHDGDGHDHGKEGKTPAAAEHHDGDGHDHGGHDEGVSLGTVDIGGVKVEVEGPEKMPASGSFHAHVSVAAGAPAGVLRIWHGDEKASRSVKTAGTLAAGEQHLDVEIASPAQAGDALWIEVQLEGQPAQRAALGGKAAAPAAVNAPATAAPAAKPAASDCSDPNCSDCKTKAAAK
ncbi:MAG: hypothetical protein RL095_2250 [Verrucomicrobiota bacterium]